jgi:hypothetical protein
MFPLGIRARRKRKKKEKIVGPADFIFSNSKNAETVEQQQPQ